MHNVVKIVILLDKAEIKVRTSRGHKPGNQMV